MRQPGTTSWITSSPIAMDLPPRYQQSTNNYCLSSTLTQQTGCWLPCYICLRFLAVQMTPYANGTYSVAKHFSMGRLAYELPYVMPGKAPCLVTRHWTSIALLPVTSCHKVWKLSPVLQIIAQSTWPTMGKTLPSGCIRFISKPKPSRATIHCLSTLSKTACDKRESLSAGGCRPVFPEIWLVALYTEPTSHSYQRKRAAISPSIGLTWALLAMPTLPPTPPTQPSTTSLSLPNMTTSLPHPAQKD